MGRTMSLRLLNYHLPSPIPVRGRNMSSISRVRDTCHEEVILY
jgi:hypothetical protein